MPLGRPARCKADGALIWFAVLLAELSTRASALVHKLPPSPASEHGQPQAWYLNFDNETKARLGGKHKDFMTNEDVFFVEHHFDCRGPEVPLEQVDEAQAKLGDLVHVAYSANRDQFQGILLSMNSAARHIAKPGNLIIHLFVAPEDYEEAQHLMKCFYSGFNERGAASAVLIHRFNGVRFPLKLLRHKWRPELLAHQQTFVRFYLHEYLPTAPRVIWLDADTIVRADLTPLYRMRMNHPVAAGLESGQQHKGRLFLANKYFNLSDTPLEWNTGVMVYDLHRWRTENLTQQCEKWTVKVNAVGGDQIGLNLALFGRIDTIQDWRWNVRGWNVQRPPWTCLDTAKVLHWSGNPQFTKKPWEIGTDFGERWRWGYDMVEPYLLVDELCNLTRAGNSSAAL